MKSFLVSGGDLYVVCLLVFLEHSVIWELGDVDSPPRFARGLMVDLGQVALYSFVSHFVK